MKHRTFSRSLVRNQPTTESSGESFVTPRRDKFDQDTCASGGDSG